MSVLITGMGAVGANVGRKFIDEGYPVIFYDLIPRKLDFLVEVSDKWKFVCGDVSDAVFILETVRRHGITGIVHTALPPRDLEHPDLYFRRSVEATQDILEVARLEKLKLIFLSSNAVYGYRPDETPMREEDRVPGERIPPGPYMAMYVATKLSSEMLLTMYDTLYGLDVVTLRTSWVYGPADTHNYYPLCFLTYALHGEHLKLPSGGDHVTNYTFSDDVANGVFLAYTVRPLKHRLFNITSGRLVSARELAEAVKKIIPEAEIELGPGEMEVGLGRLDRHDLQKGLMDISRAKEELGYQTTPLEEGLRKTVEWWKKQKRIPLQDPDLTFLPREFWEPN